MLSKTVKIIHRVRLRYPIYTLNVNYYFIHNIFKGFAHFSLGGLLMCVTSFIHILISSLYNNQFNTIAPKILILYTTLNDFLINLRHFLFTLYKTMFLLSEYAQLIPKRFPVFSLYHSISLLLIQGFPLSPRNQSWVFSNHQVINLSLYYLHSCHFDNFL